MSAPIATATATATPTAVARAPRLLAAALAAGIAGDLLLHGDMWRAGATLWVVGIVTLALLLGDGDRERRLLLVGAGVASLGLALRDAPFLWPIDFMSVMCMGALVVWHGSGRRIAELTVVQAIRAVPLALLTALGGAPAVLRDGMQASGGSAEGARRARALGIGAVLAVPPLFVVAMLLSNSDAVFGGFVEATFEFLSRSAVRHAIVILLLSWAAAGWLRSASGGGTSIRVIDPPSPGAPFLVISVGLYGMVLLLATFLGTQARALFGGEAYLQAATGLTRAAYARNGFFEMVAASGIVLGTLVAAEWLMASEDEGGHRRFRAAGVALVIEVAAILLSAITRMGLYVGEFGLSTERAFAIAVMVLVCAALVTLSVTTLRGRAARFAPAMLGVTIAWVTMLNLVNLEALVVRVNVARAVAGETFDAGYLATLSADALPALRAAAPRIPAADCRALQDGYAKRWAHLAALGAGDDWRSSNWPIVRARRWQAQGASFACAAGPAR